MENKYISDGDQIKYENILTSVETLHYYNFGHLIKFIMWISF